MITKESALWRSNLGLTVLFLLLILFTASLQWLPLWRIDLTEEKLYTLSDGSRAMLNKLQQPVQLSFYFSDQATAELPQQRSYAQRVRELLQEYERYSGGLLTLREVDPEPFSEAEDRAADYGLQGIAASAGGDMVYFGLVGERTDGEDQEPAGEKEPLFDREEDAEVITFFTPEREAFLEYDISQLVYRLGQTDKPVVGLISSLPLLQGYGQTQQQGMGWLAVQQLQQTMLLRKLDYSLAAIDADIDLLLIVQPSELEDKTRYAIDQYVLAGGATMIFVDPNAEMAAATPMAGPGPHPSDLSDLFAAWGIAYDSSLVVGDSRWGLRLPTADSGLPLPHIGIIGIEQESINRQDLITAELESINLSSAGFIQPTDTATTQLLPLLSSSELAQAMPTADLVAEKDHGKLLQKFSATGEVYTLMARVSGEVKSAFPNGVPAADPDTADTDQGDADKVVSSAVLEHLDKGSINIIVAADTDMLSDRLWVQVSNFFGQSVASPWANNGDLSINAADNMTGSKDLISVRSRGAYSRPFVVIEDLQVAAAERFRQQEQQLVSRLDELESKISALNQTNQVDADIELSLTAEQQLEIEVFEDQRLQTRKQLRQVQHQLNKDIESLQNKLALVNILSVPAALTVLVLLFGVVRRRRSKA